MLSEGQMQHFRQLAILGALLLSFSASAQAVTGQPLKLVVPFPAGGGTDIIARKLGEGLRQELGQPVIVENRAGASGNIGADSVARSAPDGRTLMLTAAPFALAPAVTKSLPFDPEKDFTPISKVAVVPLLLVTKADSPINSVADLIAQARKNASPLSYATFGNGTPPHLVGESIQALGKFELTHVPYKGGQAALPDILSGRVDVAIMDVVSMMPLIKSGRLKALAITGSQRSPELPNVPTLTQAGVPFDTVGWYGLFGPARLEPSSAQRLNEAVTKVMATSGMRQLLIDGGSLPVEPAVTAAQWKSEFSGQVRAWGNLARQAKLSPE